LPACIVELIVILDGHSGQSELTPHCRAFLAATRVGKGAFGARQLLCGESEQANLYVGERRPRSYNDKLSTPQNSCSIQPKTVSA